MIAREWDRTLITTLTAPTKPFGIVLGYVLAGVVQALAACAVFIVLMSYIVGTSFGCIPLIALFIIVTAAFFSSLAVVTAMGLDNLYQQVAYSFDGTGFSASNVGLLIWYRQMVSLLIFYLAAM